MYQSNYAIIKWGRKPTSWIRDWLHSSLLGWYEIRNQWCRKHSWREIPWLEPDITKYIYTFFFIFTNDLKSWLYRNFKTVEHEREFFSRQLCVGDSFISMWNYFSIFEDGEGRAWLALSSSQRRQDTFCSWI